MKRWAACRELSPQPGTKSRSKVAALSSQPGRPDGFGPVQFILWRSRGSLWTRRPNLSAIGSAVWRARREGLQYTAEGRSVRARWRAFPAGAVADGRFEPEPLERVGEGGLGCEPNQEVNVRFARSANIDRRAGQGDRSSYVRATLSKSGRRPSAKRRRSRVPSWGRPARAMAQRRDQKPLLGRRGAIGHLP